MKCPQCDHGMNKIHPDVLWCEHCGICEVDTYEPHNWKIPYSVRDCSVSVLQIILEQRKTRP